MKSTPYLIRRDGIYYFRKACPKALRPLFGRSEFTKSLRTSSIHLARKLAVTMATDLQKLFDEISSGLDLLQPRQVEIVATHVYREKVTPLIKEALESYKDRQDSDVEWEAFHARTFGQEIKSDLQSSRYETAVPEVDRLIKLNGLIIEKHSAVYKRLCRGVLIGLERVYQAAEKITKGNFEDSVFNFEPQIALSDESGGSAVTLKIAVDKYLAENQRDWAAKHYRSQKAKLEHFMAFMGEGCLESGGSVGLEQVSSNDARRYKELLQNTPTNASQKYPDLTVVEVVDTVRQSGEKPLGTTSINNYIQCVSTLFSWAATELDYQGPNHFKGRAKRVSGKSRRDERNPFSKKSAINILFLSAIHRLSICKSLSFAGKTVTH